MHAAHAMTGRGRQAESAAASGARSQGVRPSERLGIAFGAQREPTTRTATLEKRIATGQT